MSLVSGYCSGPDLEGHFCHVCAVTEILRESQKEVAENRRATRERDRERERERERERVREREREREREKACVCLLPLKYAREKRVFECGSKS